MKTIPSNKKLLRFEVTTLNATLNKYATLVKDKKKAIELLNKAIVVQEKYASAYSTKVFPNVLLKLNFCLNRKCMMKLQVY